MELTNTLFFVFLQVHLYGNVKAEHFYYSCVLESGKIGRCTDINSCPGALEKLNWYQPLDLCGFNYEPIICCEYVEQNVLQQLVVGQDTNILTAPYIITRGSSGAPVTAFVGGVDARKLEFPHMAILGYGESPNIQWLCGGSLISENFILTAAHCTHRKKEVMHVMLGAHYFPGAGQNDGQMLMVKNIYTHPDYKVNMRYHDIALLELDQPANKSFGIRPARLYTARFIPTGYLIATGWGATERNGNYSNILQKGYLIHVCSDICNMNYEVDRHLKEHGINNNWQFCADGGGEKRDTCQGDSGGPLQILLPGDTLYTIVGITSIGISCAEAPSVYTRVSYYVPWIQNITMGNIETDRA